MNWEVPYITGKLLERKFLKCLRMTHLSSWNISYGQKKGRESNCQFDFRPLKVRNCSNFISFKWLATYCWNFFDKGYNFVLDLTSIGGLHTKLCASKVVRVITFKISRLLLGSLGTKWNLGAGLMAKHKVFYKKEVVASSKFGLWWVLWVRVCPWWVLHQKCSNYALTKLLFGLCKFIWIMDLLANHPSPHPKVLTCPFYPQSATS